MKSRATAPPATQPFGAVAGLTPMREAGASERSRAQAGRPGGAFGWRAAGSPVSFD
ncbi:renilla-luciferin 2-monooxygenase [Burkholderia pseudomallei]|nr:renilla-luciferin 2-monooxygenase [Burkholderia pseudomallei]EEP51244.1 renilla-luciferin 2-monooxygenase [Burkholderia pseudomallei MSHR346]EMP73550.1 luciferase [Burkholderia pseudomallei MSHR1043]EQA86389.1 renilla-luciferin 2-monooxygenase [Burkholderia pseudomallei MSHR338]APZ15195.1 renilla-luciferin 2-monooxygenase [Burkholderia pseudomallei]